MALSRSDFLSTLGFGRKPPVEPARPVMAAEVRERLEARIRADVSARRPRRALFGRGLPGRAADDYLAPGRLAVMLSDRLPPGWFDSIAREDETTPIVVPDDIARLADSRVAEELAACVIRDANRKDGRSPLPVFDEPGTTGDVFGGFPVFLLPRTVYAVALLRHQGGHSREALALLLSLLRLEQDLGRGGPIVARMLSMFLSEETGRLFRRILRAAALGKEELVALLQGFGELGSTEVSLADTLRVEVTWRLAILVDEFGAGPRRYFPAPRPRSWKDAVADFVLRLGQRGDPAISCPGGACAVPTTRTWPELLRAHGGIEGLIERNEREEELWCRASDMASSALSERLRVIETGARDIWGAAPPYLDSLRAWYPLAELRRASVLGTHVCLALEVDRQRRGTLPASLAALDTTLLRGLPRDPISGRDFEYEIHEGRGALRSGTVEVGGKEQRLEIPIG